MLEGFVILGWVGMGGLEVVPLGWKAVGIVQDELLRVSRTVPGFRG